MSEIANKVEPGIYTIYGPRDKVMVAPDGSVKVEARDGGSVRALEGRLVEGGTIDGKEIDTILTNTESRNCVVMFSDGRDWMLEFTEEWYEG